MCRKHQKAMVHHDPRELAGGSDVADKIPESILKVWMKHHAFQSTSTPLVPKPMGPNFRRSRMAAWKKANAYLGVHFSDISSRCLADSTPLFFKKYTLQ